MSDCNSEIDCRTAVQQLWDYLDEELTPERMDDVRRHLERCGSCLPHHDYAPRVSCRTGRRRETATPGRPTPLRHRVMENLRAAGFSS